MFASFYLDFFEAVSQLSRTFLARFSPMRTHSQVAAAQKTSLGRRRTVEMRKKQMPDTACREGNPFGALPRYVWMCFVRDGRWQGRDHTFPLPQTQDHCACGSRTVSAVFSPRGSKNADTPICACRSGTMRASSGRHGSGIADAAICACSSGKVPLGHRNDHPEKIMERARTTLTNPKRPELPRVWFRRRSRTFEQLSSSSKVPTRGMESAAATNPLLITQLLCRNPEKRCPTCPSCRQPASAATTSPNVSSLLACARSSTWTSRQGA